MESLISTKTDSWLSWFLRGILILGFLFLTARLFELQIVKGSYFRALEEENRIRRIPISAPRGQILARGGEVLVGNRDVKKKIIFSPKEGFEKVDDLGRTNSDEVISESARVYPLGFRFAHASGFLGEVGPDEVGKINPECPEKGPRKLGSLVGRAGLEEEYDCILSGYDGEELVEVNSQGKKVRTLGKKDPIAGKDIRTSIDFSLQQNVADIYTQMQGATANNKGAVVILDPDGQVLALFSSPSFDPNLFVGSADPKKVAELLTDANLPLFNRALGGAYHPGSVFKPIVAAAALTEGTINKDFVFEDPGVITIGKYSYSNWFFSQYGKTEGKIDLTRALTRSTDTFFYKLGEMVGIDKLSEMASRFGFGKETGVDIPGEVTGLVPTPDWKLKTTGEAWFLGNTYHVAIGQGDLTATPIQVAQETSILANGGKLCKPRIFVGDVSIGNCVDLGIKSDYLDLIKKGMVGACESGGTGYTFFDYLPRVACKTGTAETNIDGKTHAWFTLFAPADNPEIVTTVLVEGGGEGSKVAGPIARKIMDYYFNKTDNR